MANLVAVRSAIRASRATLTAPRAERRSTAAGLSAADLARAVRSSWGFFAFAAALRRSAMLVFLGQFISILYTREKAAPRGGVALSKLRAAAWQLRVSGPAIRKLFDWPDTCTNRAVRGPKQVLGVVQPPLAASLYSASLT